MSRPDAHRSCLTNSYYPAENQDVEQQKRFPRPRNEVGVREDRLFKDCWTKDGKYFREEDDSQFFNHMNLPTPRNGSVIALQTQQLESEYRTS